MRITPKPATRLLLTCLIPAILIIDLEYPYWHTQGDTLDKVSARSLDIVGDTLVESVREIARQADLGKVIED